MRRCPECRPDYYDDSLLYCLEDGTTLIQGSVPSPDEPQTAILHESAPKHEASPVRSENSRKFTGISRINEAFTVHDKSLDGAKHKILLATRDKLLALLRDVEDVL